MREDDNHKKMATFMPAMVRLQYNYGWGSVEQVVSGGFEYVRKDPDTITIRREAVEGLFNAAQNIDKLLEGGG